MASTVRANSEVRPMKKQLSKDIGVMHPNDLAKDLQSITRSYLLLDCRPILAYNSCHITGRWGGVGWGGVESRWGGVEGRWRWGRWRW